MSLFLLSFFAEQPMDTFETKQKPVISRSAIILDWVEQIVYMVIGMALLFTFVCRIVTVSGTSMLPNYAHGDQLLVMCSPISPKQGDVVVLVDVLNEPIIKRVIATEYQTVSFDKDKREVFIDGQPMDENSFGVAEGITELPDTSLKLLEFPQTVPAGCVFVLGDNRPISEDSRYQAVGMVDQRHILGKAVFRLFPPESAGLIQ